MAPGPRPHRQARRRDRLRSDGGDPDPGDGAEGGARDDAAALAHLFIARPTTHELALTLRELDIPEDWTYEILRRAYIAQIDQLARMSYESPEQLHSFLIESMRPSLPEGC